MLRDASVVLVLALAACAQACVVGVVDPDASELDDAAPDREVDANADAPDGDASADAPSRDAPSDALADARDATGRDAAPDGSADASADASDADADRRVFLPPVLLYNLRSAPFPGTSHPDVAVHVPPGFDPHRRVGAVVYFHGHYNCVANVLGNVNTACPPGTTPRTASRLAEQLDASRANAILVAVQLGYDTTSYDAGQLARDGQLARLLDELLVEHLDPLLGRALRVADLDRVSIASHSGGYHAAATVLQLGGVPQVREVDLYDSLYGDLAVFRGWIQANAARFDPRRADGLRFFDVYTADGGTASNSMALATQAGGYLRAAGLPGSIAYDDTTSTWPPERYATPVMFKRSALSHTGVLTYYFQRVVAASGFEPRP